MIITDRFVYIHVPKTGGTFVTKTILGVHRAPCRPLWSRIRAPRPYGPVRSIDHKHAPCSRIPDQHREKPILSTIRSPFEYYVSHYEFGVWRTGPTNPEWQKVDWLRVHRDFPHFPNLSFAEYMTIWGGNDYGPLADPTRGEYTWRFIRTFATGDSSELYHSLNPNSSSLEQRFYPVRFLHTENLNAELFDALLDLQYPRDAVAFVTSAPRTNPTKGGRNPDQEWRRYYSHTLLDAVVTRDALLFRLFPEYAELI